MDSKHRLTGFLSTKLPKISFWVGLAGLLLSLIGYIQDSHHYFYSYLTAFMFFAGLSLSSMFLVLVQFLTRGGWGTVVRRIPEHFMKNIPLLAILFIPILFGFTDLYHWADPHAIETDHLIQVKAPYLNKTFFIIRSALYFVVWLLIAKFFFRKSTEQDLLGGTEHTSDMQKYSAISILGFALTFSFASFDWVMSLNPHWYSTIFGLYVFANSTLVALCATSLMYHILRKAGFLKDFVTIEHFHDLGKLTYGFIIFWTYIAFSQFFLIWYANIPEETSWYLLRLTNNWEGFSYFLLIGHFIVPLFLFMSRHAKRNIPFNIIMNIFIIIMCYFDFYYMIMPTISKTFHFSFTDITCFIGIGGLFMALTFKRLRQYDLIPSKDPRLGESLHLEN